MRMRADYTLEYYEREFDTDHEFSLPFDTEGTPDVWIAPNGLKAVLACLMHDDSPSDPFEEFDEGEFFQFDHGRAHDTSRPDLEEWKRIIRANPGRVVTVESCNYGFSAGVLALPSHCRSKGNPENCPADAMRESMAGYYIAPEDVTDPLKYAEAFIEQYSAYCEGEVFGVVVWTYRRDSIADGWGDPERDECWSYYGADYAGEELKEQFVAACSSFYHD